MLATLATVFALVTAAVAPSAAARAGKPALTRAEADSITHAIEKGREEAREWLRSSPTSYLATVQRIDFGARERLTVGSAPDNLVRLEDAQVQPHHLSVHVVGDSFHVEALDDSAWITVKGATLREVTLGPSTIALGRFSLRLSHQRYPAIIVFDPLSPRLKPDAGMDHFPPDMAWRFVLPLTPNAHPDTVVIVSTRGSLRRAVRVGWFRFEVRGVPCRLEADRLLEPGVGEHDMAVFFRDRTTGKETYPVGRYLDPVALPDGRFLLDFNLAYNPACAYSEHYNCPIPPRGNRLGVAVRAGEKDPHHIAHAPAP